MLVSPQDVDRLRAHLLRHMDENGQGGLWFMGPRQADMVMGSYDPRAWRLRPPEPGWQRVWGWRDVDGELRAHVVLTSNPLAPWRCTFALGVEMRWRRQGHAHRLASAALDWVHEQDSVDWIDSWTFTENEASIAFHEALGFEDRGRVQDVVRVDGQSLGQVIFLFDLRSKGSRLCH